MFSYPSASVLPAFAPTTTVPTPMAAAPMATAAPMAMPTMGAPQIARVASSSLLPPVAMAAPAMYEDIKTVTPFGVQDTIVPMNPYTPAVTAMAAPPVPTAALPSYTAPQMYAASPFPTAAPMAMAAPAMYEDIKTVTPFGVQDTIVQMNPYAPAVATMAAPQVPTATVPSYTAPPMYAASPVTPVPSYTSPPVYAAPPVPTAAPMAMAAPAMYEDIRTLTPFGVQDTIVQMNPYAPAVTTMAAPQVPTATLPSYTAPPMYASPPVTTLPSYTSPPLYAAPPVPTAAPMAMAAPAMYEDIRTVTPFGVQDTMVQMNPYASAVMNPYVPGMAAPVPRVASASLLPQVAMAPGAPGVTLM